MPAETQSKADTAAPFGSLFELRRAHSELMRSAGDRAQISELTQRIRDFLARAAATGAVLRASDEREAAQYSRLLECFTAHDARRRSQLVHNNPA